MLYCSRYQENYVCDIIIIFHFVTEEIKAGLTISVPVLNHKSVEIVKTIQKVSSWLNIQYFFLLTNCDQ